MNIRARIFGGAGAPGPILKSKEPKGATGESLESVAVPRSEPRCHDTRHDDRHRLSDETILLTHQGTDHQVELINLSGGGAMVSGDFAPMLWDKVELHLGSHGTVECAVRWLRDGRIGLEFAHETRLECGADEQAELLRAVIARSFPDIAFESREEQVPEPAEPAEMSDSPDSATPRSNEDHRVARRHPLIWSGVLHHDYQSTPVRIRNISASGAMIESSAPVRVGAEPLLEFSDSASISATVEWVVGDQVGLRFHHPFDLTLLAGARPQVAPSRWMRPDYLEPQAQGDSPWDSQWQRLSLSELSQELEGFLKR